MAPLFHFRSFINFEHTLLGFLPKVYISPQSGKRKGALKATLSFSLVTTQQHNL